MVLVLVIPDPSIRNMVVAAVVLVVPVMTVMLNPTPLMVEMVELVLKSQPHSEIQQLFLIQIQALSGILLVVAVDLHLQVTLVMKQLLVMVVKVVVVKVHLLMVLYLHPHKLLLSTVQ